MAPLDKPLVWLHGEVRTPPLSSAARVEAGVLLRRLQRGENLTLPLDEDALVILEVFARKTPQTPQAVIDACRRRLRQYDEP